MFLLASLHAEFFFMFFMSSADFFFKVKGTFLNFFSEILPGCQTVWIQTWPDVSLALIWEQAICKGYQQTTKDIKSSTKEEPMLGLS